MKKALLLGESWTTHMIHQKGFDSFTTTEYVEGGQEFLAALTSGDWTVDHVPAHAIESRIRPHVDAFAAYDLVIISDVGVNTFLLTRNVFAHSQSEPNRLEALRDYVLAGGGLIMVGGYLSFSGVDAKAGYGSSALADILPVEIMATDDRSENPQGARISVLDADHPALGGVGSEWPELLGFNRTVAKPDAILLARVDGDPLVAVSSAGMGRTAVFTSDMSPHWAPQTFLDWQGYVPFWRAICEWTAGAA